MKILYCLCIFQVHLCEAVNIGDYLTDEYLVNRTVSRPVLVAVKMLYYLCIFQVHLCEAVNIGDYQSPLILTELFQNNLINVSYLTACYLYQVMMTLHVLNDVANDAESTQ